MLFYKFIHIHFFNFFNAISSNEKELLYIQVSRPRFMRKKKTKKICLQLKNSNIKRPRITVN